MDQLNIEVLGTQHGDEFIKFLCRLNDETYSLWNRFGYSVSQIDIPKVAYEQCRKSKEEEMGFVAVLDKTKIVAYGCLMFFPRKKERKDHVAALGIVVEPEHQNKGVGIQLMKYMHQWAQEAGFKKLWLSTYVHNKAALGLYKRMNYYVEGIFMYEEKRKNEWDHVVSMACMLDTELNHAKDRWKEIIHQIHC